MAKDYTRRGFMKGALGLGMTTLGAGAGYEAAKGLTAYNPLERIADEFYQATHDTLAEVTGAAEERLANSIKELEIYMGGSVKEARVLQEYWDNISLVEPETFSELEEAIQKSEYYLKESDFKERMTRLKDRLTRQTTKMAQSIESRYPEPLRNFNEWFSELTLGEEEGSREALQEYTRRLDTLVGIYDSNRDNKIAQADLLDETEGYFAQAQGKVITQAKEYLNEPGIKDTEKDFYQGLVKISEEDPTGRTLAYYLLETDGYFRTMGAIDGLEKLSANIEENTKKIKSIQGLMDRGIELKKEVRETNRVLPQMVSNTERLISDWEEKRKELQKEGHDINYDLFPNLKEAHENFTRGVSSLNEGISYAGAGVGGLLGAFLSGYANWIIHGSDRKCWKRESNNHEKTKEELQKTRSMLEEKEEKIRTLKNEETHKKRTC